MKVKGEVLPKTPAHGPAIATQADLSADDALVSPTNMLHPSPAAIAGILSSPHPVVQTTSATRGNGTPNPPALLPAMAGGGAGGGSGGAAGSSDFTSKAGLPSLSLPGTEKKDGRGACFGTGRVVRRSSPQPSRIRIRIDVLWMLGCCLALPGLATASSVVWPSSCAGLTGYQSSCTCTATSFEVPADVNAIPPNAFAYCGSLVSVVAHPAVDSVGERAFYRTGLEVLAWPAGATTVPARAFFFASSLREITGLEAVDSVDGWAFYGASSLPHVYLPPGCTIVSNAFAGGPAGYSTTEHWFYGTHAPSPSLPPSDPSWPPAPPESPPPSPSPPPFPPAAPLPSDPPPAEPPAAPAPPSAPTSGAVFELSGAAPRIKFGTPSAPACEIALKRDASVPYLETNCEIHVSAADSASGRRASEVAGFVSREVHEALKAEVIELRRLVQQVLQQ